LPARYVVLEGGDGCGKDTQLPIIEERMKAHGLDVAVVREPYDSPTYGEMIRDMLYARNGQPDFSELYWLRQAELMNLARKEVIALIHKKLLGGQHVLSSRNWFSTMAYQGHGQNIRPSDIEQLRLSCCSAASAVQPDLLILIDLPAAEALGRQAYKDKDVHEVLPVAFHEAVRAGYLAELDAVQKSGRFPAVLIDASGVDVGDMTDRIWAHIEPLLK